MKDGNYRSICGLCHAGCGIVATVENGCVTKIAGDPDHPGSKGTLCPKAFTIPEIISSPQRLKRPMIRRSRSEALQEVSWDEALDFAAERLSAIREKYGPKSLIRCGGSPVNYESRDGFLQFMAAYGSENVTGAGNCCMVSRVAAYTSVMGGKPEPDAEHTRLLIYWASNPEASNRTGSYCAYGAPADTIQNAKNRGAKVIVVDPVYSETAKKADQWIRLNCGSDAALLLAMMNHIIAKDLYDHNFVENYTEGFELLRAHVAPMTPEWAAPITGLAADEIRAFADEFAVGGPAAVSDGNGTDMYANVCDTSRALAMLQAMCGYIDVPGGTMFLPFIPQRRLGLPPTPETFGKSTFPLFPEIPFPYLKEALLREDPKCPRAMIAHHSNPVLIQPNSARTREALGKLEFLLVDDIFPTATTELADVVLPSSSPFERWCYKAASSYDRPFMACTRPIAEAPGEAKSVIWMEYQLAKRMGLEGAYPFQDEEGWVNYMIEPSGITLEQLKEEQICFADKTPVERKYEQNGFFPGGGKLRFYSADYARAGRSPMPVYREPSGGAVCVNEEFPLLCTSRRPGAFVHTKLHNLVSATKEHPHSLVWMSAEDAAVRGLGEGDPAVVRTPVGEEVFYVHIAENQPVGLAAAEFGWGNPTDDGPSINTLTTDAAWDTASGAPVNRISACQITRA